MDTRRCFAGDCYCQLSNSTSYVVPALSTFMAASSHCSPYKPHIGCCTHSAHSENKHGLRKTHLHFVEPATSCHLTHHLISSALLKITIASSAVLKPYSNHLSYRVAENFLYARHESFSHIPLTSPWQAYTGVFLPAEPPPPVDARYQRHCLHQANFRLALACIPRL